MRDLKSFARMARTVSQLSGRRGRRVAGAAMLALSTALPGAVMAQTDTAPRRMLAPEPAPATQPRRLLAPVPAPATQPRRLLAPVPEPKAPARRMAIPQAAPKEPARRIAIPVAPPSSGGTRVPDVTPGAGGGRIASGTGTLDWDGRGDPRCAGYVPPTDRSAFTIRIFNDFPVDVTIQYNNVGAIGQGAYYSVPAGAYLDLRGVGNNQSYIFTEPGTDRRTQLSVKVGDSKCYILASAGGKAAPAPVQPTPAKPTPVQPTPVNPTPVKPTPVDPAVNPAPIKPSPLNPFPPVIPNPPLVKKDDPDKKDCTQAALATLVTESRSTGTLTLDGGCRYMLVTPIDTLNNKGVYFWDPVTIEGNGAIIERTGKAQFALLAFSRPATLRNLTLRNGASSSHGGAFSASKDITVDNVTFEGNSAKNKGGAVAMFGSSLTVRNSRFIGNVANGGGGAIFSQDTTIDIANNVLAQNRSGPISADGQAMYVGNDSTGQIVNNTVTDNVFNNGTAITMFGSVGMRNNIVANHETGLYANAKGANEDSNLFAGKGSDVKGTPARGGNSRVAADAGFTDPAALDYTLTAYSGAIDRGTGAGVPAQDAAGAARPFQGGTPDIGAFEFQGRGLAALSVTHQGPFWLSAGEPGEFKVTVKNEGLSTASAVTVTDVLPATARFDSASDGGSASGRTISWNIGNLAPNQEKVVTYKAIASDTMISGDLKAQSSADPKILASARVLETPVKKNIIARMNFLPRPDGYSFPNWGKDVLDSDLTTDDLVMIFGRDAACTSATGVCVPKSTIAGWRRDNLAFVEGGHCAGMAMSSLEIFANPNFSAANLQAGAKSTFELTQASARRFVTLYATTQTLSPTTWGDLYTAGLHRDPAEKDVRGKNISDPADVLDTLIANLKETSPKDRYRINVRRADGSGGHTVVPFAVENVDGKGIQYRIYVYENNQPDNFNMSILVNRSTGAWKYVAQTNPSQPVQDYIGTKSSDTLTLTSWRHSTAFPKCPKDSDCPYTGAPLPVTTTSAKPVGSLSVDLAGAGYPMITRSDGARAGYDPVTGQWISEIEGAVEVEHSLEFAPDYPPGIRLPHFEGMDYAVSVVGKDARTPSPIPPSISITGPAYLTRIEGLTLMSDATAPASLDLSVAPDDKSIAFGSNVIQQVSVMMAADNADKSGVLMDLTGVALAAGGALSVVYDEESGEVTVQDDDGVETLYDMAINRANTDGTEDFFTDRLSDSGAALILSVGSGWPKGGAPQVVPAGARMAPQTQRAGYALQAVNYPGRYLSADEDGQVKLVPVSDGSPEDLKDRAAFEIIESPAVPGAVMLRISDGSDRYLVVTEEGVRMLPEADIGDPARASFRTFEGLAGQGTSFESVATPGAYLRHSGFVLRTGPNDGSELFSKDATFVAVSPF